jgi:tricarballylate dehydrogenase
MAQAQAPESASGNVIVIGAGIAGLSAALAAHEKGASPIILEAAPEDDRGGNTAFAAGAFRFSYRGVEDILRVIPDLSEDEIANTEFGEYTDQYYEDMERVTGGRCAPDLLEALVSHSLDTAAWLRGKGVRFLPSYGKQTYKVGTKIKFRGGSPVVISGGGLGLLAALYGAVERAGIPVLYETRAVALERTGAHISGVQARGSDGGTQFFPASAVVVAAGGFESSPELRARYLGAGWDLAKVRGTRHNVGDGLQMAIALGAGSAGHWSGCHSVAWDLSAPEFGDIAVGVDFKKDSYPYGIVVNTDGARFLDEGADFSAFTYAKYGAEILRQPNQMAWQVFDSKVLHLLRDEYRIRQVTKVRADTLEELAENLYRVDPAGFLRTVKQFNAAVQQDVPFNSNVKDGRGVTGLPVTKTNWANRIDTPPFEAYAVTCGITFTFGGLRVSPQSEVLDAGGRTMPGLFACGSSAGGLFYGNYPGGSGLVAAAVFGKLAGAGAAATAAAV